MQLASYILTSCVLLAATLDGRWRPGIGDPTVMGWLTAVGYAAAALLCALAAMRERRFEGTATTRRLRTAFWWVLACAMLFLAVNKQLDLQTFLTQTGREWSKAQGWYQDRRAVQHVFIWSIAGFGTLALLAACMLFYQAHRRFRFALAGIAFLLCFIVIRAASFHKVDDFLGMRLGQVKMNWLLECGGIFIVAAATLIRDRRK